MHLPYYVRKVAEYFYKEVWGRVKAYMFQGAWVQASMRTRTRTRLSLPDLVHLATHVVPRFGFATAFRLLKHPLQ